MIFKVISGEPSTQRGMVFMILATMFLVTMNTGVRIASQELHPFEIAFFRNFMGLLFVMPILLNRGLEPFKTGRLKLHITRGILNAGAMLLYFYGISLTPIAKTIAIAFSAQLFATVMSVFILGEVLHQRRIVALIIGFAGGMIILRPGLVEIDIGSLSILLSAAFWGGALIVIKILSRTESSLTIVLYTMLFLTPLTLIPAIPYWQWPTLDQLPLLIGIGIAGTTGQYFLAQSFKEADITAVLPFDFTKLIWAAILGYLMFAEIPDIWVWVGGTAIFGSTTYIAYRERQIGKTKQT